MAIRFYTQGCELREHNGKRIISKSPLNPLKYDIEETGPMFNITVVDSASITRLEAFEYEIITD